MAVLIENKPSDPTVTMIVPKSFLNEAQGPSIYSGLYDSAFEDAVIDPLTQEYVLLHYVDNHYQVIISFYERKDKSLDQRIKDLLSENDIPYEDITLLSR